MESLSDLSAEFYTFSNLLMIFFPEMSLPTMPKVKGKLWSSRNLQSVTGKNVVPMVFDALRALQHRGQEAWGFAVPNKPPFKKVGSSFSFFIRI